MISIPKINLPESYLRTFDFIPLHSIKNSLDPNLEVSIFKGESSVQIGSTLSEEYKNRDHDLVIARKIGSRNKFEVKYHAPDYYSLKDIKDLYAETMDLTGAEVHETVIQEIMSITPNTIFDQVNKLAFYQHYRANRTASYKKRFGLKNIANPYRIAKNLMLDHGVYNFDTAKRIKSHLRLENILGIDDKGNQLGYETLLTTPEFMLKTNQTQGRFPPEYSKACTQYAEKRWWMDTGVPRRFMTLADGVTIEGALYLLNKNQATIIS